MSFSFLKRRGRHFSLVLTVFALLIFSIGFVSAEDPLDVYKQGQEIDLKVSCVNIDCSNPSGARITIEYPNTTLLADNATMTIKDAYANFTFSENTLGKYNYYVESTGGSPEYYEDSFKINPSGNSGNENMVLFIMLFAIAYGIGLFGFFGKNEWVSIFGGMAMMALGVYTINEGFIIYRDWLTIALSYITIGLGAIFAIIPGIELMKD